MSPPQLSAKVQELIAKSRIVSFATWHEAYSADLIRYFQNADEQSRYLTDEDLAQIQALDPSTQASVAIVQTLRDHASTIIDEARASVLATFPELTEPGGKLYPAARAEACWRDFWQFLRCITYGIAGQRTDYTSADGLHHMQLLYRELQVPLDAMVLGLEGLKEASLRHTNADTVMVEPYFDHLIRELQRFQ